MPNTGQFTLKLLHWDIRFWPFKTGFCKIEPTFKTVLTVSFQWYLLNTHVHKNLTEIIMYSFQILLLSMKDMNIAKLTSVDLPLFNGIMSDLFPGIETPVIDYSKVSVVSNIFRKHDYSV